MVSFSIYSQLIFSYLVAMEFVLKTSLQIVKSWCQLEPSDDSDRSYDLVNEDMIIHGYNTWKLKQQIDNSGLECACSLYFLWLYNCLGASKGTPRIAKGTLEVHEATGFFGQFCPHLFRCKPNSGPLSVFFFNEDESQEARTRWISCLLPLYSCGWTLTILNFLGRILWSDEVFWVFFEVHRVKIIHFKNARKEELRHHQPKKQDQRLQPNHHDGFVMVHLIFWVHHISVRRVPFSV